jgi:diamine N-acetyltransferase
VLELRSIVPENYDSALALAVKPGQERFVAPIVKSLADAFVYREARFRLAFHNGLAVGYILVFPFDEGNRRMVNIVRLMIDARYQGEGLGRELLSATLDWICTFSPKVDRVRISTIPENEIALRLYRSAGFEEAGIENGEVALYRDLP